MAWYTAVGAGPLLSSERHCLRNKAVPDGPGQLRGESVRNGRGWREAELLPCATRIRTRPRWITVGGWDVVHLEPALEQAAEARHDVENGPSLAAPDVVDRAGPPVLCCADRRLHDVIDEGELADLPPVSVD